MEKDCERDFPEIALEECVKLRERLLGEAVVMINDGRFAEMLVKAIKERCPALRVERIEMKLSYWADRGGVYSRCGVRRTLYDEFGERFGCAGYVFLADLPEVWQVLKEKGEVWRL
jgi:hypothetical protein